MRREIIAVLGESNALRKETRMNILDRIEAFTDAEFKALPRNADGDIIDLYVVFVWLTPEQVDALTGDDCSRVDDYKEELRCMVAEFA